MIRGVPYDHQLEYIESTGSQWIDTGVKPKLTTKARMKVYNKAWTGDVIFGFTPPSTVSSWDNKDWRIFNHSNTVYFDMLGGARINGSTFRAGEWRELEIGNYYVKDLATGSTLISGTTRTDSSAYASNTYTLTLNKAGYNGSMSQNKWAYVKIYDGETLVQDLIPVSVNGVAKMYDRVTGTFPKHYGTFVAGPVASTPLMGVHMYPQVHTVADYVQDGLLAGWSGIAQGGIPYVWKDFSGHKYDLTINPNTSHFESNYLNVGSISTAGAYMEGVLIPGVKHMEICCYVSQKTTNALLFYNGVVPSNMILASHSTAGVLTSNTKRHTAYKRTTGYYALSATHDILYADGTKVVDTTFSSDSWSGGSNSLCLFGRLNDTIYGTAGRIYSARAYSRELTPEEVAHNYRIDKLTFDLPDPE